MNTIKYAVLVALLGLVLAEDKLIWYPHFAPGLVSSQCLRCICQVESKCKPVGCTYDVYSDSCGFFQIKLPYWRDCGSLKPKQKCDGEKDCWKKCANDETCSSACVQAYMNRFVDHDPACHHNCESYARLHNGGPRGCTRRGATDAYWKKVQAQGCSQ